MPPDSLTDAAEGAKQWHILLRESDGTRDVVPGKRYLLKGMERIKFLQQERHRGINLGWTDDAEPATADRVIRWRFVHSGPPDRPVQYGELVAIGWDDKFLRRGRRKKGVDLTWSDEPVLEWRILGGSLHTPVSRSDRVALYNEAAGEPLVTVDRAVGGNIGWPSDHTFPENDVVVLRDYADGLPKTAPIIDALDSVVHESLPIHESLPSQAMVRARNVNGARKKLLELLRDPVFKSTQIRLSNDNGTGIYNRIAAGVQFEDTLRAIDDIAAGPDRIGEFTVDAALTAESVTFTFEHTTPTTTVEVDGKKFVVPEQTSEVPFVVEGYPGPRLRRSERKALNSYAALFGSTPEREFRLGVLRAESHLGQRDPEKALVEYRALLDTRGISATRRKYLALRAAAAHLAAGERTFREARRLDDNQRAAARTQFNDAVAILANSDIVPFNPQRSHLERKARRRLAQLDAHLNVLGLRDSFVPVQKLAKLEEHVTEAVANARDAATRFEDYLKKADALEDVEAELLHEKTVAIRVIEKADFDKEDARLQAERARNQLAAIEAQQRFTTPGAVLAGLETFFSGGGQASIFGIGSALVRYRSQQEELAFQHSTAVIDVDIAELQQQVAEVDFDIAELRKAFITDRLDDIDTLDNDRYNRLAGMCRELAEQQIQRATRYAFLYERSVAYLLGDPEIIHLHSFDYVDHPEGVLGGVVALETAVDDIGDEFMKRDLPKFDDYVDTFSMRQTFPIEFALLQQTGKTSFALSLYDLEKRRPGCWQARLIRVDAVLRGLIPVTMAGTLTHMGRFVVRDLQDTLDPTVTRLLPQPEDVDAALERQRRGETTSASVGGVVAFAFGHDTKNLDLEPPAPVPTVTQPFAKELIEDYGPAGVWRLELRGFDLANLTDVELRLNLRSFETDIERLQPKIERLIDDYEAEQELAVGDTLDRISSVSLRAESPDTLAGLGSGPVVLRLSREHFRGAPDPRVKIVIALPVDADGKGIPSLELRITKPDADFELVRTTGKSGFTEDLSIPLVYVEPNQRFDPTGEWGLALADPPRAADVDDLRLFFVCDFTR